MREPMKNDTKFSLFKVSMKIKFFPNLKWHYSQMMERILSILEHLEKMEPKKNL